MTCEFIQLSFEGRIGSAPRKVQITKQFSRGRQIIFGKIQNPGPPASVAIDPAVVAECKTFFAP